MMRTQMMLVPLAWLTMAGSGGVALGQSAADRATAEQLFQEGRVEMSKRDFAAACPKFESSFALDPALGTRLNLAVCYEHIDRLASAWEHYRAVADLAAQAGQDRRAELARTRLAAVEPRVPRLVVRVPAAAAMPGLVITRGDTTLAAALHDRPIYVDAGEHHVHARAPGRQPFALAVRVATGEERVVEVPLLAPVPGPPVASDGASDAPLRVPVRPAGSGGPGRPSLDLGRGSVDSSPAGNPRRTLAWVAGGTGAAGLALGLALGWTARDTVGQLLAEGGPCDAETLVCRDVRSVERMERARSQARAANVAAGGGIALMAAGGILYWTTRDRGADARSARVVPTAGATGLGLAVMGRF